MLEAQKGGMKQVKKLLLSTLLIITILLIPSVQSSRIPNSTTIPPVPAVAQGVIYECQPFAVFPGSVVPGTDGFIRVECPGNMGALVLNGLLTPTAVLSLGYINAGILSHGITGDPCSLTFGTLTLFNGTSNITVPTGHLLNQTMNFSPSPHQGDMLTGVYDYCLQYQNAPSNGLTGFSVTWT